MSSLYYLAAGLATITGLVHSVLGERLIFRHLRKGTLVPSEDAPPLRGRHVRILWATWHLGSVFGWAFAGALVALATGARSLESILVAAVVSAYTGGAVLVFVGTRGRHPGWAALLAVAVLAWLAAGPA
ncbi:hypothetical protein [Arenimonas metalli]|uniref:Uncharacterized protein n=1 Tax=Arenimonas metalli CF5-1 TaxID=1384056 RepID=A0A091B163_9GAMM|nr:hypothetical protein [Arenimonas metalli]KFN46333.1 hypothetical protein N787_10745 [Arenimonas metalli CF5-1]